MFDMKNEPWRPLLKKAADLIEERGLAKDIRETPWGSLCFFGALNMAEHGSANPYCGDSDLVNEASLRFCEWRKGEVGRHGCSNAEWNNESHREWREVCWSMRKCAEAETA